MTKSAVSRREMVYVGLGVAVIALLYRYAWIPVDHETALQRASETWGLSVTEAGRWFSAWALGDGQAFAVIASDPLGISEGWNLGNPAYRYSRAGYGWVVWLLSFGQEQLVPYSLALVGSLSLLGLFMVASRLRPLLGRRAWLIVLNPAVFIGFAGDTAEPLAILTLAWALASGSWLACIALGMVRPSYIVSLSQRWRSLVWAAATAGILAVLWLARFGFDLSQYGGALGLPVVGYVQAPSFHGVGLALVAVITVSVGVRFTNRAWILSGVFVLMFSPGVVELPVNSWRAGGMLLVLWAFGPRYTAPILSRSGSMAPEPSPSL